MRFRFFNLMLDQKECEKLFKKQTGTVSVEYASEDLFKPDKKGILVDIVAGAHYFLIEKCENQLLKYFHSSPGTGTLVAAADLGEIPVCDRILLCFNWSPTEINLYIRPLLEGYGTYAAKGTISAKCYQIGRDGAVYRLGDEGVEILEVTVCEKGKKIMSPTAIQSWDVVLMAIENLWSGVSEKGYIYEVILANLTISMLVTGFEIYTRKRFLETEKEGFPVRIEPFKKAFIEKRKMFSLDEQKFSKYLKTNNINELFDEIEKDFGRCLINFQNYSNCRKAYKMAYEISFEKLGLEKGSLSSLTELIQYRHKVLHESPIESKLNEKNGRPMFIDRAASSNATTCFKGFINGLHRATLGVI